MHNTRRKRKFINHLAPRWQRSHFDARSDHVLNGVQWNRWILMNPQAQPLNAVIKSIILFMSGVDSHSR